MGAPPVAGWRATEPGWSAQRAFVDSGFNRELGRRSISSYRRPVSWPGAAARRFGPYRGASPQRRWALAALMRRLRARRVARALRLNRHYAQRLGWLPHLSRIAQVLGIPPVPPNTVAFARAVARWQRRGGFALVNGILSPEMWRILQTQLGQPIEQAPAPDVPPPMGEPPQPWDAPSPPSQGWGEPAPPAGAEPAPFAAMPEAVSPNGSAPPANGGDAGASNGDGASEFGWGL